MSLNNKIISGSNYLIFKELDFFSFLENIETNPLNKKKRILYKVEQTSFIDKLGPVLIFLILKKKIKIINNNIIIKTLNIFKKGFENLVNDNLSFSEGTLE